MNQEWLLRFATKIIASNNNNKCTTLSCLSRRDWSGSVAGV